jgi:predicted N-acetyltransferase YhbS
MNAGVRLEKPADREAVFAVPEEVFMLKEFLPDYLAGYSGVIRYDPAFANV